MQTNPRCNCASCVIPTVFNRSLQRINNKWRDRRALNNRFQIGIWYASLISADGMSVFPNELEVSKDARSSDAWTGLYQFTPSEAELF